MSKALEIASERYAKGEISRADFDEIKDALSGQNSSTAHDASEASHSQNEDVKEKQSSDGLTPRQISENSDYTVRNYFSISFTSKILVFLLTACAIISGLQAVIIFKQSGIQARYNMAYAMENEPPFLIITLLPYLIAVVAFLFWKKKSTDNLFMYKGNQTITPAGAVYWYFVPVAWFWKPYEAMKNLVVGFNVPENDKNTLPLWWLAFWGSAAIVIVAVSVVPENIQTESDASLYVGWQIAIYIADAISLVAAQAVVSTVSTAQKLVTDTG